MGTTRLTALVAVAVLWSAAAMAVDTAPVKDPVVDYVNELEQEANAPNVDVEDTPLSDDELAAMYESMAVDFKPEESADVDLELEPPMSGEQNDDDAYTEEDYVAALMATEPVDTDEQAMDVEAAWDPQALDDEDDAPIFDEQIADAGKEELPAADKTPLAPANADESSATKAEKKAHTMSVRGEAEFESFADPDFIAHAAQPNTVEVKRSRELHFNDDNSYTTTNLIFAGVVGVCASVAVAGAAVAGVAYYKLQKERAADMTGVSAPAVQRMKQARSAVARGDQKNAYSAQLHHYQQTKNEIIRIEQNGGQERADTDESDAEHDEPDYSVYECPGLAPTGDIEVANPIFDDKARKQ